jgi:hypothetical protein
MAIQTNKHFVSSQTGLQAKNFISAPEPNFALRRSLTQFFSRSVYLAALPWEIYGRVSAELVLFAPTKPSLEAKCKYIGQRARSA